MEDKLNRKVLSFFLFFSLLCSLILVLGSGLASAQGDMTIIFAEGEGGSIAWAYWYGGMVGLGYGAGTYEIPYGSSITILGTADSGYNFANFTFTGGSGFTTVNPIYTNVYSEFNITANFQSVGEGEELSATVSLVDGVGGHIAMDNGFDADGLGLLFEGSYSITKGTEIALYGFPVAGYDFLEFYFYYANGTLAVVTSNVYNYTVLEDVYVTARFSVSSLATPSPTHTSYLGSIMDSDLGRIVLILLIVFVPPMLVLVGAPKVGYMGFFVMLLLMVLVGVQFNIIPSYFLIVMVIGFALMFFSSLKQVT